MLSTARKRITCDCYSIVVAIEWNANRFSRCVSIFSGASALPKPEAVAGGASRRANGKRKKQRKEHEKANNCDKRCDLFGSARALGADCNADGFAFA